MSPEWLTAVAGVIAAAAILGGWLVAQGGRDARLANAEKRLDAFETELRELALANQESVREMRESMNDMSGELKLMIGAQHERLLADLSQQDAVLLGLVEEKGRSDARHDENRRLLESIDRRLQASGR